MYNNYYAPFQRPIQAPVGYYNPSIPNGQEAQNYQPPSQYQQPIQPMAQQNTVPQNPLAPQNSGGMIWVLNENEAVSYPVAPNNSVILWDKNKDTIYIKSANMQGVPSIQILDYNERVTDNAAKTVQSANNIDSGKFVCIDDFNALQAKFDGLQSELNELKAKSKPKTTKKEVSDDE